MKEFGKCIGIFALCVLGMVIFGAALTYCENRGELNASECSQMCEQHLLVNRYGKCDCVRR
jgi:hypothetical protein